MLIVPQSYSVVTCSCTRGEGTSHGSHCWTTCLGWSELLLLRANRGCHLGWSRYEPGLPSRHLCSVALLHLRRRQPHGRIAGDKFVKLFGPHIAMPRLKPARNSENIQSREGKISRFQVENVFRHLETCSIMRSGNVQLILSIMFNYNYNLINHVQSIFQDTHQQGVIMSSAKEPCHPLHRERQEGPWQ